MGYYQYKAVFVREILRQWHFFVEEKYGDSFWLWERSGNGKWLKLNAKQALTRLYKKVHRSIDDWLITNDWLNDTQAGELRENAVPSGRDREQLLREAREKVMNDFSDDGLFPELDNEDDTLAADSTTVHSPGTDAMAEATSTTASKTSQKHPPVDTHEGSNEVRGGIETREAAIFPLTDTRVAQEDTAASTFNSDNVNVPDSTPATTDASVPEMTQEADGESAMRGRKSTVYTY